MKLNTKEIRAIPRMVLRDYIQKCKQGLYVWHPLCPKKWANLALKFSKCHFLGDSNIHTYWCTAWACKCCENLLWQHSRDSNFPKESSSLFTGLLWFLTEILPCKLNTSLCWNKPQRSQPCIFSASSDGINKCSQCHLKMTGFQTLLFELNISHATQILSIATN